MCASAEPSSPSALQSETDSTDLTRAIFQAGTFSAPLDSKHFRDTASTGHRTVQYVDGEYAAVDLYWTRAERSSTYRRALPGRGADSRQSCSRTQHHLGRGRRCAPRPKRVGAAAAVCRTSPRAGRRGVRGPGGPVQSKQQPLHIRTCSLVPCMPEA